MPNSREHINAIYDREDKPFKALWQWASEPKEAARRAERFASLAEWAKAKTEAAKKDDDRKAWRKRKRIYRHRQHQLEDKADTFEDPGYDGGWHPDAVKAGVVSPVGGFSGPKRLVWHSTEGYGLPAYSGSNPHFTINPATGQLWQHQPVTGAARALVNSGGGVETNTRGAIQVEIIGFAKDSQGWSDNAYAELADLARWIEKHCGVARSCDVSFPGAGATPHMSADKWNNYNGHCGHCHVPENAHWDPGAMNIAKILDK